MAVSSEPFHPARRALSRRWLPRSFYARAALILIVPIVAIQLAVAVMFLQRHYEDVTVQMTDNLSREIALLRERPDLAEALGLAVDRGPVEEYVRWWDLSGRAMRERLEVWFPDIAAVSVAAVRGTVILGFEDGMRVTLPRTSVSASNPHQLLVLMVGTAIVMTAISMLFMRGQIRPIRRLAAAAEAFGRGEAATYWPAGASEVRAAGTAFLEMRARIERHIEQRTLLLSGVSHDLRTPLTRMRLELSMMEGPEVAPLLEDVAAMERIIATFLDFAREGAVEARRKVDLAALVADAVARAAPGGGAALALAAVEAEVQPEGVGRAVGNLVRNAARYGTGIRVSLMAPEGSVVIAVEDDGPGIAEAEQPAALRPFGRLDAARTDTAGNVGLGLAIVRDVARAHGGTLRLGRSDLGGLKAEIVLPRQAG